MVMDRQQLARAIEVGRSSTLNCFETTKDIAQIAAEIAARDGEGRLFRNRYLNESIVFKQIEPLHRGAGTVFGIRTLIYFPYNHENIYEGGDSILLGDPRQKSLLKDKCGLDPLDPDRREDGAWDTSMLSLLDPFLLRCKAQQKSIEAQLNPLYFNITEAEWQRIQAPVRQKIDGLVRKAIGAGPADNEGKDAAIERHVSRFLTKIWEARDIEGIEEFVRVLNVSPESAPEVFFAWKAICYYQVQFRQIGRPLKRMFAWFGDPSLSLPVDLKAQHRTAQEAAQRDLHRLRCRLRDNYRQTVSILDSYEESYQTFIEEGRPEPFKRFLADADGHYIDLAGCLSANTHAINLIEDQRRRSSDQMSADQHRRLLDCLLALFGIEGDDAQRKRKPVAVPEFVD